MPAPLFKNSASETTRVEACSAQIPPPSLSPMPSAWFSVNAACQTSAEPPVSTQSPPPRLACPP